MRKAVCHWMVISVSAASQPQGAAREPRRIPGPFLSTTLCSGSSSYSLGGELPTWIWSPGKKPELIDYRSLLIKSICNAAVVIQSPLGQFMMALQSPQLSRPAGMPPVAAALSISFCSTNDLRPSVWHGVLTPKKAILQLQMSLIGCALRRSLKLLQSIRERFPTNWTAQKKKNHGNHNALGRLRGFFTIKTFKIRFFLLLNQPPVNLESSFIGTEALNEVWPKNRWLLIAKSTVNVIIFYQKNVYLGSSKYFLQTSKVFLWHITIMW